MIYTLLKPHASIQSRLVLFLSLTLIPLLGLSALGLFFFMRHALHQQVDINLIDIAEDFIHETGSNSSGELECEFHELNFEKFRKGKSSGAAYYELRDHHGKPLIRSASLNPSDELPYLPVTVGQFTTKSIILPSSISGRAVFSSFYLKFEHGLSDAPAPIFDKTPPSENTHEPIKPAVNNLPENLVYLTVAEDPADLHQTLFILATTLILIGIILAGVTFILIRKVVNRAILPIVRITQITEEMGPDNLNTALPENGVPSDLLPLISKFNQFIQRLDDAISRERRFSIGLAHELRTPVTEIRSLMEVAAESTNCANEEPPLDIYQRGAAISTRLSKIIEVISSIHQDHSAAYPLTSEPINIESTLRESIKSFTAQNQARFEFQSKQTHYSEIDSDPTLMRAIIDNLLTNAIAHSPKNSQIRISWQANGFSIKNTTQDLKESDLLLFNEAFWQKDSARTETNRFGLGLTLVALYLRLLNGRITQQLAGTSLTTSVTFLV